MTGIIHRNRMTRIIQVVGHSQDEKAASHRRIVEIAAGRIREAGTEAPGVAEIMRAAGLTHGGFYKHFDSRDQLISEAASAAVAHSGRRTDAALEGAEGPLAAFVDFYLSPEHRDDAASGCALAGLGPDAARGDDRVRGPFGEGVEAYLDRLEGLLGSREDAVVALSSLLGALLLSRALGDAELSDEVLADVGARVKAMRRG
jgi:TetR/AcrR family transcriptional repressor of nem operon